MTPAIYRRYHFFRSAMITMKPFRPRLGLPNERLSGRGVVALIDISWGLPKVVVEMVSRHWFPTLLPRHLYLSSSAMSHCISALVIFVAAPLCSLSLMKLSMLRIIMRVLLLITTQVSKNKSQDSFLERDHGRPETMVEAILVSHKWHTISTQERPERTSWLPPYRLVRDIIRVRPSIRVYEAADCDWEGDRLDNTVSGRALFEYDPDSVQARLFFENRLVMHRDVGCT